MYIRELYVKFISNFINIFIYNIKKIKKSKITLVYKYKLKIDPLN